MSRFDSAKLSGRQAMLFFFFIWACLAALIRKFDPMIPGKNIIGSTRLGGILITCGIRSWGGVKKPSAWRPQATWGLVGN